MSTFHLTVSSPEGDMFSGEVQDIILRGAGGDLAILAGHIPFVTTVKPCKCKITMGDEKLTERYAQTDGGLLTVSKETVTFLCGKFDFTE